MPEALLLSRGHCCASLSRSPTLLVDRTRALHHLPDSGGRGSHRVIQLGIIKFFPHLHHYSYTCQCVWAPSSATFKMPSTPYQENALNFKQLSYRYPSTGTCSPPRVTERCMLVFSGQTFGVPEQKVECGIRHLGRLGWREQGWTQLRFFSSVMMHVFLAPGASV